LKSLSRRATIAAATLLTGVAAFGAAPAAQAATPGTSSYVVSTSWGACVAQLNFHRSADARNTAQAEIDMAATPPQVNSCVGALWESANGGRTWSQVSGTHTTHASWSPSVYSASTNWYADGVSMLAKACLHEHFARTDTDGSQVCTTAH
jgi:hypothetical protein